MKGEMISPEHLALIITATFIGTLSRLLSIKQDYRQYPSYPNGYLIHSVLGAVASALGAFIIPAIMTKNFIAVTFLTLAIQQFREVRKTERGSLNSLENTEFTFRGDAYIDGIAKTFESRNYFSLITSFSAALAMEILKQKMWIEVVVGAAVGLIVYYLISRFTKGKQVIDIADVKEGRIEFKGNNLYVDGIFVSNLIGMENPKKMFEEEGLAAVIYPKEEHYRITLDNFGQRQAILFDVTRELGVKRYSFTRKDYEQGRIVIALIPIIKNKQKLLDTIKNAPLLENAKKSHAVMKTKMLGGN
ncbi:MAG: YIEGIA family protein [Bacillota bacterium]|nr:YIEGIA family protein [Bacillota bacterium]